MNSSFDRSLQDRSMNGGSGDTPRRGDQQSGRNFLDSLVTSRAMFLNSTVSSGGGGRSPVNGSNMRQNQYQPSLVGKGSPMINMTPKQRGGMGTSCPQPSPERMMLQMSFIEKKLDEITDKFFEESRRIYNSVITANECISGEIKNLSVKVQNISLSQNSILAEMSSLKQDGNKYEDLVQRIIRIEQNQINSAARKKIEFECITPPARQPLLELSQISNKSECWEPEENYVSGASLIMNKSPLGYVGNPSPIKPEASSTFATFSPFNFNLNPITPPQIKPEEISTTEKAPGLFSSFSFGKTGSLGFGDLTTTTSPAFSKPAEFKGFGGEGKQLFGNIVATNAFSMTPPKSVPEEGRARTTSEGGDGEDFVPTAEFAPVIPLPPLVEVKLGDENEVVLFEHRAKIYRLDAGEWKERGIGNIKILQDKNNSSSIRVVMWREKVGKLACNHRITGEMKLEYHQGTSTSVRWSAIDHAEGDAKPEIFVCKFGQEEKCKEFKKKFEEMVDLVASSPSTQTTPTKVEEISPPTTPSKEDLKPLSELFKKAENSWDCDGCYVNNEAAVSKCPACGTKKPGFVEQVDGKQSEANNLPTFTPFTFGFNPIAPASETKPEEISTTEKAPGLFSSFSFGTAGTLGFGDLATTASTFSKPADFKGFGGEGKQLFGNIVATNAFSMTPPKSVPEEGRVRTTSDGDGEDFVPTAEFAPVIPLPPLVEVKLGDENEVVLFEHRAKIYRHDSDLKDWKERGIGNIKILQDKNNSSSIRVVMWREKVGKLACNHRITGEMKLEHHQQSNKAVRWSALDYAEGDAKPELFACRFGQEEKCTEFKKKFEEMVDLVASSPSTQTTPTKVEEISPPTTPSKGDLKPLSELFKKAENSWDCDGCYVNNEAAVSKCPACGTKKPGFVEELEEVDGKQSEANNLPTFTPFTFGFNPIAPASETKPEEISTTEKAPGLFSNFSFGKTGSLGFGDLTMTTSPAFSKPAEFKGFGGEGKQLFGNIVATNAFSMTPPKSVPEEGRARTTSEGDGEDFVPTAEFAPVIPLPPLVEVKLGDENEVVLFEHRAKIYRHDSDLKDWKERGIGNIKILQDKNNSSSIRVVMWREKVGKLACNHRITGEMKLEYHQQSNKAVRWSAIDYAEGDAKPELFACRFGQEEKCKEFKMKFEEMVELVASSPLTSTPIKLEENSAPIIKSDQPLSELFKKAENSWDCNGCYVNNEGTVSKCPACGTMKPGVTCVDLDKSFGHPTLNPDLPIFNFGLPTPTPAAPTNHSELPETCPDAWASFDAARVG